MRNKREKKFMREWKYKIEDGKLVWKELEKAMTYNSRDKIFSDWLDLILNSLLALTDNMSRENLIEKLKENKLDGKYNERYLEIVKKYSEGEKEKRSIDYLCNAWALLQQETQEKQKDILGDIYMQMITFGEHGQFFTPEHITDSMAKISGIKENEIVNDPCCGSGRFLISALKENPNIKVSGGDLDERCAKMAVINIWFFNGNAEIKHQNSLSNKVYKIWRILKGGFIYEKSL